MACVIEAALGTATSGTGLTPLGVACLAGHVEEGFSNCATAGLQCFSSETLVATSVT